MLGIYNYPKVINTAEDKPLEICMPKNYSFSRDFTIVPVGMSELVYLAALYPIVFAHHEGVFAAFAVLGGDANHYLTKDGKWKIDHKPKVLDFYPFGAIRDRATNNVVVFYDKIPEESTECEEIEFVNVIGEATEHLQKISQMALGFYQDFEIAANLIKEMHDLKILRQTDLELKIDDDEKFLIEGAVMPDPGVLLGVSPEKLYDLTRRGVTPVIYNVASSLMNVEFIRYLKRMGG
jgi:hypothetical protein